MRRSSQPTGIRVPPSRMLTQCDDSTTCSLNELLHCAPAAVECIVFGPVCGCVCVCVGGFCYHDNSKMRASILTKLGFSVKIVTISDGATVDHGPQCQMQPSSQADTGLTLSLHQLRVTNRCTLS